MICVNECYNMDCADGMREMLEQGLRADWLITDPPYGIGWTRMTGGATISLEPVIMAKENGTIRG